MCIRDRAYFMVTTAIACVIGLAFANVFNSAGLFLGGSILAAGERAKLCRDFVSSAYAVIEQLMSFIISLAPIGVFTYMAWVVATQGSEILVSLLLVIVCAYLGYIVHAVLVYSLSAKIFVGMNPIRFFKGAFAAMIFAFTSTSSAATLPVSKECAAELGAEDDIASFVLPLGSTINMDGTAIYQCVAVSYTHLRAHETSV